MEIVTDAFSSINKIYDILDQEECLEDFETGIKLKEVKGEITYKIKVKNNGEVSGDVTVIKDYLDDGLSFDSENVEKDKSWRISCFSWKNRFRKNNNNSFNRKIL